MSDWITGFVEQTGYIGIGLLMLAENLFPPIPSEVIMPLAGHAASQGRLNLVLVVLSGSAGSVIGASVWYYVGLRLGSARVRRLAARHGRWLTITPGEIDRADQWFRRHCGKAVVIGRVIPTIRTLISLPAGIAEMRLPKFVAYTTAGTVLWTGLLAGAGFVLGAQYQQVSSWFDPISNAVIAAIVVWYVYRLVTFKPQDSRS